MGAVNVHNCAGFPSSGEKDLEILSKREVLRRLKISNTTLYEMTKSGEFPRPFQVRNRKIGWLRHEVDEWIRQRAKNRVPYMGDVGSGDEPEDGPGADPR